MPRLTRLLPALLFAALAACSGDEPAAGGGAPADSAAPAAAAAPPEEVQLTPAESAAAVARIQKRGEAVTRRVRAQARELDPPPLDPPHVETPESIYRSCVAQAGALVGPERERVLELCERRRPSP